VDLWSLVKIAHLRCGAQKIESGLARPTGGTVPNEAATEAALPTIVGFPMGLCWPVDQEYA
jgi:hypothetical protein